MNDIIGLLQNHLVLHEFVEDLVYGLDSLLLLLYELLLFLYFVLDILKQHSHSLNIVMI